MQKHFRNTMFFKCCNNNALYVSIYIQKEYTHNIEKCEHIQRVCLTTPSPCWKLISRGTDWQTDKLPVGLKSTLILFNLLPPSAAVLAKLIIRNTREVYCTYSHCFSAL